MFAVMFVPRRVSWRSHNRICRPSKRQMGCG